MFTDGKIRLIGTVRLNFVDGLNKPNILKAIQLLKDKPRGSWVLVGVLENVSKKEIAQSKKLHNDRERKKPANERIGSYHQNPGEQKKLDILLFLTAKLLFFTPTI